MYVEVNIDAIVGPTHHFGGVGVGNLASGQHRGQPSSPRRAALEGLRKARLVASLGVPQFVLPPLVRPLPNLLSRLGFEGSLTEQCTTARNQASHAYSAAFSSAFMWAANAGTFAPACDSEDGRHHLTLANLSSSWHRLPEHADRYQQFHQMFTALPAGAQWQLHAALPPVLPLRDEGAANHMRLCDRTGTRAIHLFIFGEDESQAQRNLTLRHLTSTRFVPRQTLAASQAVARLHKLEPSKTFFLHQHPQAIDAGVFHNDVIATSHRNLLLVHEQAFDEPADCLERVAACFQKATGEALHILHVSSDEITLEEAVKSYLFNSQIVTPAEDLDAMVMICAEQCRQSANVKRLIDGWINDASNPIADVHYVALNESMSGGGGPACLRLRLSLPAEHVEHFAPGFRLSDQLFDRLQQLIENDYPERLTWEELGNEYNLHSYHHVYKQFLSVAACASEQ